MSLLKSDVVSAVLQALSLPSAPQDMTALCVRVIRSLSESGAFVFVLCVCVCVYIVCLAG